MKLLQREAPITCRHQVPATRHRTRKQPTPYRASTSATAIWSQSASNISRRAYRLIRSRALGRSFRCSELFQGSSAEAQVVTLHLVLSPEGVAVELLALSLLASLALSLLGGQHESADAAGLALVHHCRLLLCGDPILARGGGRSKLPLPHCTLHRLENNPRPCFRRIAAILRRALSAVEARSFLWPCLLYCQHGRS